MTMRSFAGFGVLCVVGCLRAPVPTADGSSDTASTSGPDDTGAASSGATMGGTTSTTHDSSTATSGWTTSTTGPGEDDGCLFLSGCGSDWGGPALECDPWIQDCPHGEKCMPWANDGGNSWNATRCSPLGADPKGLYEPCTVEGNAVSGVDDCDAHMMCWNVDSASNEGICYGFCLGSPDKPTCGDPQATCQIYNNGVLPLCFPPCNPLGQDCTAGQKCVASPAGDGFICVNASSGDAIYGEPCEHANGCTAGLFCAAASQVPGCRGAGCCTEFCDLTTGDEPCDGFAGGQECIPWYEPGRAPAGYETLGVCLIPR